jgi:hypothetical protein
MKKISTVLIFILIFCVHQINAQAFEYPSNPSPSWLIMDSSITEAASFSDTLLKGTHSLYLLQKIDSIGKQTTFTYRYVDGNGDPLNFIYNYSKNKGIRMVEFIEIDGRKDVVMNIFNHYFHTTHEWDKEKENGNVREFVFKQKTYILKMSENKKPDGDADGTVRSAILNYQQ